MFEWATGNAYAMIVTIYSSNFTLNTAACNHFKDYKYCMLGLDKENKKVAIKAVSKEEIDLGLVYLENLHKISIGKGYARISNKVFIEEIYNLTLEREEGLKYAASFDEKEKMLIIDLNNKL